MLRQTILRPGLPLEAARFDGDDEPTTVHYAAFLKGQCVGCATFWAQAHDGRPARQLRGMATATDRQRHGIGTCLLAFALADLSVGTAGSLFWCNARVSATGFYERQGWRIIRGPFHIPSVGPHYLMTYAHPKAAQL